MNGTVMSDMERPLVAKLREWVLCQPAIVNPVTDDCFLLRFIRFRKCNLADAKKVYVRYVKTRDQFAFVYKNLDVLEHGIHDLFLRGYVFPLLERDREGRTVVMVRNGAFGQKYGHQASDLYRSLVMTLETLLLDHDNQLKGLVYIVDFEGQSLSDIAYVGLLEAQKVGRSGEKCYPVSHKEAHWVNASRLVRTCFWFLISFIPEHLKKRLRMHKDYDSLKTSVGASILPLEYGGDVPWKVMADRWITCLEKNRSHLLEMDKMYFDETKLPSTDGA
ncbi:Alpha-tocopherol transfer protein-like [Halotydeus destructor]|nr:Alpha-tocopherol transfer protein-like [Halotydeus destructor]